MLSARPGAAARSATASIDISALYKTLSSDGFAKSREKFDAAYARVAAEEDRLREEEAAKAQLATAALSIQGAYRSHLRCAATPLVTPVTFVTPVTPVTPIRSHHRATLFGNMPTAHVHAAAAAAPPCTCAHTTCTHTPPGPAPRAPTSFLAPLGRAGTRVVPTRSRSAG